MKQLRRYSTFDVAQPREMADAKLHAFRVCKIGRPNCFLTFMLPADAASSFVGLGDKDLKELPCHPPASKYAALETALANAVANGSIEVFEASGEVAVGARQLRSNMGGREREVEVERSDKDILEDLDRESFDRRQGHFRRFC